MESGSKRTRIISEPVRYMDKLDEFILVEILQRLPSVRSVTQCKPVCRHWNSVISCPHFSTRFLKSRRTKKEFSIVLAQEFRTLSTYTLLSNDSNFQNFDYNFASSVLKSTPYNHTTLTLEILATYNELLLCLHRYRCDSDVSLHETIRKFYVYNPLTKQHVALPPSPVLPRYTNNSVVGFLCRGQSSFRVVHIIELYNASPVRMHIFSSEENKWMKYSLTAFAYTIISYPGIMALPWNGLLCWMSYRKLIVCDPYSTDNQHFHFITTPWEARDRLESFRFGAGVFRGTLRLWRQHRSLFSVWDLKDYNTEEWSLKHRVQMDRSTARIRAAAFDPNDEDVVYYSTYKSLIALNMRSRDSSPVKASLKTSIDLPRFEVYPCHGDDKNFFMLLMAGFPTTIPTIPQNATASEEWQDQGVAT